MTPLRSEIWLFDCGITEKVRSVLVLSVPFQQSDRALVTVVFHTTALRGSEFEVAAPVSFLSDGAFLAQSLVTYPATRAIRRLGRLDDAQMSLVDEAVFRWLGRNLSPRANLARP